MGLSRIEQSRRLATAIREGLCRAEILKLDGIIIQENPLHYLAQCFPANGIWCACAIGHAVLGMSESLQQAREVVHLVWTTNKLESTQQMCKHFASLLGVNADMIQMVDNVQREDHRNIASILPDLDEGQLSFKIK
jgi:hypothetical protein